MAEPGPDHGAVRAIAGCRVDARRPGQPPEVVASKVPAPRKDPALQPGRNSALQRLRGRHLLHAQQLVAIDDRRLAANPPSETETRCRAVAG